MMNNLSRKSIRWLLAITFILLPVVGHCDWILSTAEYFGLKGKNMDDVATKIATLSEENEILGLDFSPDGKYLAAMPFDSATVHIWDWQGNRLERTLERTQGSNVLVSEPVRYSPDGKLLAICHSRSSGYIVARIWNTDSWMVVHDITDPVGGGEGCNAIGFAPDGKSLIRGTDRIIAKPGDNLFSYDTASWQMMWGFRTVPFQPAAFVISPDGRYVALGGKLYDFSTTATELPTVDDPKKSFESFERRTQVQIAIFDLLQRKVVRSIQIQSGSILEHRRVAWSPDGKHLAYAGRHGVEIFDTHTWARVSFESSEGKGQQIHIRYTPDGKYFIESGFGEGGAGVRIWDGQHQQLLQEIKAIPACVAVSRDGRYLAMGGNKKIIVWQLK
jgi:WD40 repeat protein